MMASMRFSGQPFASASSTSGSSFVWSRTTPPTTSRKNAASAGRYLSPSTSLPSQWLSNSANTSFRPAPAMSIWYRAWTAASRAAPRRLAFFSASPVALAGGFDITVFDQLVEARLQPALDTHHDDRGTRSIASLVQIVGPRARPSLLLGIDGDDAIAERQLFGDRQIHQPASGFHRDDLEMDGLPANDASE